MKYLLSLCFLICSLAWADGPGIKATRYYDGILNEIAFESESPQLNDLQLTLRSEVTRIEAKAAFAHFAKNKKRSQWLEGIYHSIRWEKGELTASLNPDCERYLEAKGKMKNKKTWTCSPPMVMREQTRTALVTTPPAAFISSVIYAICNPGSCGCAKVGATIGMGAVGAATPWVLLGIGCAAASIRYTSQLVPEDKALMEEFFSDKDLRFPYYEEIFTYLGYLSVQPTHTPLSYESRGKDEEKGGAEGDVAPSAPELTDESLVSETSSRSSVTLIHVKTRPQD